MVGEPPSGFLWLGLEGVDVADVVEAWRDRVGAVAADDLGPGRWRVGATELGIILATGGGQGDRLGEGRTAEDEGEQPGG